MELTDEEKAHFLIVNSVLDKYIKVEPKQVIDWLEILYRRPNQSAIIATNDLQRDYLEREFYL
jgi:hypothetical protein